MGLTVRKSNWLVKHHEARRIQAKDGDELLGFQPTKGRHVFRAMLVSVKPTPAAAAAAHSLAS